MDNYTDWANVNGSYPITVNPTTKLYVPASCCDDNANIAASNVTLCRTNPGDFELKGCFTKFEESIDKNSKNILIVGVTIVVIMVSIVN